jgi:uncharacterized protein involved in response to NO
MLKPHAEPRSPKLKTSEIALFALGFRPFFSVAGISAVLLLATWLGVWFGAFRVSSYYGLIPWHSHEMLFGFTVAVIAGFLLTAVRNWTGVNTPNGKPLLLLTLLWLAARILPAMGEMIPGIVIAMVDLAFLPALALAIKPALWQGKMKLNRIFVPLLLIMAIANLLMHLQFMGISNTYIRGADSMMYMIILIIVFISGRVMPFFAETALPDAEIKRNQMVETTSVMALGALILAQIIYPKPWLIALLATSVAITQIVRLIGWHDRRIWGIPILWVLYTGMFWITIGFILKAMAAAGMVNTNLATHALTVGGIGVLTLGMMSRVTLGHTGRPMQPPTSNVISYILLNIGAVLRVLAPILMPERYQLWIHLSGGIWILCFLLFSLTFVPMLVTPRVDGKEG